MRDTQTASRDGKFVGLWCLEGKPKERNHLGALVEDGEDNNNETDLKEICCQTVDLTYLTQDKYQCRAAVNRVVKLVSTNTGIFSTSQDTVSLST